jgi:hypothetical protein
MSFAAAARSDRVAVGGSWAEAVCVAYFDAGAFEFQRTGLNSLGTFEQHTPLEFAAPDFHMTEQQLYVEVKGGSGAVLRGLKDTTLELLGAYDAAAPVVIGVFDSAAMRFGFISLDDARRLAAEAEPHVLDAQTSNPKPTRPIPFDWIWSTSSPQFDVELVAPFDRSSPASYRVATRTAAVAA